MIAENVQSVLLGTLLLYPKYVPDALSEGLDIEMFDAELQPVFAAVQGYWTATGKLDICAIREHHPDIAQMLLECSEIAHWHASSHDTVKEWSVLIQQRAAVNRFQSLALQSTVDKLDYASVVNLYQQMGEALNLQHETKDFQSISELVDSYIRHKDEKPTYIPTGISSLDKGLHLVRGNYFLIGGRPSAGKTALSLQMACHMAKQGYRVCYFSLETDPDTLANRIIANQLYIPLSAIKNKNVSTSELDRLAALKKLPLFIRSASGKNTAWMKAQALRMRADVIFVDYLQLIHEDSGKDRYQAITAISIALHELAQTTGILVVALAQLNRNAARTEPSNADLRDSGQLEQDADAILLLSNDGDKYFSDVSKNKEGSLANPHLVFDAKIQRFDCEMAS